MKSRIKQRHHGFGATAALHIPLNLQAPNYYRSQLKTHPGFAKALPPVLG